MVAEMVCVLEVEVAGFCEGLHMCAVAVEPKTPPE